MWTDFIFSPAPIAQFSGKHSSPSLLSLLSLGNSHNGYNGFKCHPHTLVFACLAIVPTVYASLVKSSSESSLSVFSSCHVSLFRTWPPKIPRWRWSWPASPHGLHLYTSAFVPVARPPPGLCTQHGAENQVCGGATLCYACPSLGRRKPRLDIFTHSISAQTCAGSSH